MDAGWIALGLALGGGALLLITLRRSVQRREDSRNRRGVPQAATSSPATSPSAAMVELHELGRDLKGEIDSKLVLLAQLTQDADRAAARLEAALAAAGARDHGNAA